MNRFSQVASVILAAFGLHVIFAACSGGEASAGTGSGGAASCECPAPIDIEVKCEPITVEGTAIINWFATAKIEGRSGASLIGTQAFVSPMDSTSPYKDNIDVDWTAATVMIRGDSAQVWCGQVKIETVPSQFSKVHFVVPPAH